MSSELDEEQLDKHFNKFREFCERVLIYQNGISTQTNPILTKMNKFVKIYNMLEANEKVEIINECMFIPFKKEVLSKGDDYSWLEQKTVCLMLPGSNQKNKDKSIMVSTVYKKCVKLKQDAEKAIDGLPDSAAEDREELNFPDIFCLYYYRILKSVVTDSKDVEKINEKLKHIETDLGVNSESNVDIKHNLVGNMGNLGGLGNLSNLGNNIGNIIQNIAPALNNIVKQKADGGINLNMAGISDVTNKLVETLAPNNPEIKKKLGEFASGFSDVKTPGDALGVLTSKLGQPGLQNAIQSGLGNLGIDMGTSKAVSDSDVTQLQLAAATSSVNSSLTADQQE